MNRLRQPQCEAVREALRYIPTRFDDKLGHDLFCSDPIFAGVFRPPWDNPTMDDGRSYRDIAHVGWPYHTKDKRITVVWPSVREGTARSLYVAVHELGHVLHGHLADRVGWEHMPTLQVVTRYAATSYQECFAEAFAVWALCTPKTVDRDFPYGFSRYNTEWFDRLMRA